MENATEPTRVEYGPVRVIGLRCAGKNEHGEFSALWGGATGFIARMGEVISGPEGKYEDSGRHPVFGLCRCLPGVTDGSIEYIAGVIAAPDAPIPPGMVEAYIPRATYVVFPLIGLDQIMPTWQAVPAWMAEHPEWQGYCGPQGCDCAAYPAFEFYPPDFGVDGQMFIYVPVRTSE